MSASAITDLQAEIANLSQADKIDLLDFIWESIEADSHSLTKEQEVEFQSRLDAYEKDPSSVVEWSQVKAEVLGKK